MNTAIVVTSINPPNRVIRDLAKGAKENGWKFLVIGDTKSPVNFNCGGVEFYSVDRQIETGSAYAKKCPTGHYARKNVGYLIAINGGADVIVETDDDNFPYPSFWKPRTKECQTRVVAKPGWANVYRYFSDSNIWPRGFPLNEVRGLPTEYHSLEEGVVNCPIQQGLADENPDVDAVYRLLMPLPQRFQGDRSVALGTGVWCPFNSQNTTWWPEAYPLLYLPAYCSFRMCDIWRSFVAQRIAWANGWYMLFHEATMWQERNTHDLMSDFDQEVVGYLNNKRIAENLDRLQIRRGVENLSENLLMCYETLTRMGLVGQAELDLLDIWLSELPALKAVTKIISE